MKPTCYRLAIVTATSNPSRAEDCFRSWLGRATYHLPVTVVYQPFEKVVKSASRDLLNAFAPGVSLVMLPPSGVVPAFAAGVQQAFDDKEVEAVLCLHDDVLIEQDGWDEVVLAYLDRHLGQECYFGFGGGIGLGDDQLYKTDYHPMQLARQGFVSNMRDAEAHGRRSTKEERVVCFDGFSAGGTRGWFLRAWRGLESMGFIHHAYDGALGCYARRVGIPYGTMLPIKVHHFGGRTAVADPDYASWAQTQKAGGDSGFWVASHKILYEQFAGQLPLRLP